MNGGQDLGGVMGCGPINPEMQEPVFHHAWERRVLALTLAMGATGLWTIDQSRFARENQHPGAYLTRSYYQIWLHGLERLITAHALASFDEIAAGRSLSPARRDLRILTADRVPALLAAGAPTERPESGPAKFQPGAQVRARNIHPRGHTRLPRYVRGHIGIVTDLRGAHVFPDSNAADQGENAQWLYTVRFEARELWGDAAEAGTSVSIDAFEPYLEPAP